MANSDAKKSEIKKKHEKLEKDFRMFQIGTVLDHIKKNWVDVKDDFKSFGKKIPGVQTRNFQT